MSLRDGKTGRIEGAGIVNRGSAKRLEENLVRDFFQPLPEGTLLYRVMSETQRIASFAGTLLTRKRSNESEP